MFGLIQFPAGTKTKQNAGAASVGRTALFGIEIDPLTMTQAVSRVFDWIVEPPPQCQIVVTPNVDHIVQLQTNAGLQQAYRQAGLVLADGWPVVSASRWVGRPLPERVPGSDLVPEIFRAAEARYLRSPAGSGAKLRVFLLGAAPGVADRAASKIQEAWSGVEIVGTYSPPLGFEKSESECDSILARIDAAQPEVLVLGLGAPKQELWAAKHQDRLSARVALCVGATIDFLAGEKKRAPQWVQALKMEWLHRLLSEPKRLAKRYWHDACVFPRLVWAEFFRLPT
ncbi:MAG: WecB/TagA/CpsF family glycosyltransferase [Planctomycetaceae bacterium]|nr:WecB/TagA/CpsF family glycosyltransferase [Planctomycetaceae bacterium]